VRVTDRRVEFVPWRGSYWPDANHTLSFDDDDDDGDGRVAVGGPRGVQDGSHLTVHANWRVSPRDVLRAEAVDGVEAVRAVTPYRLDLGVAALFSAADVTRGVRAALCGPASPRPGARLAAALARRHPAWAVAGRGPREAFGGPDRGAVEEALARAGLAAAVRDASWAD
jgi:hypothetical protein